MYNCLEDLSHDQGDPHNQEVSTDDAGGVNGTGSPRHDAGPLVKTSLKSTFKLSPHQKKKAKMEKGMRVEVSLAFRRVPSSRLGFFFFRLLS